MHFNTKRKVARQ